MPKKRFSAEQIVTALPSRSEKVGALNCTSSEGWLTRFTVRLSFSLFAQRNNVGRLTGALSKSLVKADGDIVLAQQIPKRFIG